MTVQKCLATLHDYSTGKIASHIETGVNWSGAFGGAKADMLEEWRLISWRNGG